MRKPLLSIAAVLLVTGLVWIGVSLATPGSGTVDTSDLEPVAAPAPSKAVETLPPPAPLRPEAEKGLAYLANQQLPNGGWGQGGGWRTVAGGGRIEADDNRYQEEADVANTAVATLALLRGGSTPEKGPYAKNVRAGIAYVLDSIERSDPGSLFVTEVRGSQLQYKIGLYVDTFLANLLLAEVRGRMPDEESARRVDAALDVVLSKIERHQRDDGTFADNQGWASVLSQSIANKSLNRAKQSGAEVKESMLRKVRRQANEGYDEASGEFRDGEAFGSTAGVKLYKDAASLAALDDLAKTGSEEAEEARKVLASEAPPAAKREASARIEALEALREEKDRALDTMAAQLADSGFTSGFGSSGGEEYLSYMNISEALAAKGGADWTRWNDQVATSLAESQNGDGSWSGQHCITGRTFVTSAALLTLLADRAPLPATAAVDG